MDAYRHEQTEVRAQASLVRGYEELFAVAICLFVMLSSSSPLPCHGAEKRPPNIVIILADDFGVGDIHAIYPSNKLATPNLDQLVSEGMHFTDAHSGSAVCTPTRYGLLTG